MTRSTLLGTILLLALTSPALAKTEFPNRLDSACRSAGRTPPNPAELARASGALFADCALCHDIDVARGNYPSGANVNADGDAYKSGNLDPFCVLAPTNQPPVLAPIGNQAVDVGQPVGLLIAANDPDGDAIAFSATGLPAGALLTDGGNGMASFEWTPQQAGNYAVTFSVTDGAATDSERVVISVGGVNMPPTLAPIGDHSVTPGTTLTLAISATDPEGGQLTYSGSGFPAGASFTDLGDGNAELVWTPAAAEQAAVEVVVTDDGVPPESASEVFQLVAEGPGSPAGPSLEVARWDAWNGELSVLGDGALPGDPVTIVDAASEAALMIVRASRAGRFDDEARPFLAPCAVRARGENGVLGAMIGVLGAPVDCGQQPLTRASARWQCRDGELRVRGGRAPALTDLVVLDAASGATLGRTQSDRRGHFQLRVASGAVQRIELDFSSGLGQWTLGPLEVRNAADACFAKKRKRADDED